MNAVAQMAEPLRLLPMGLQHVDAVLAIEQATQAHAWTRQNFCDTLLAGHYAQVLVFDDVVRGYCIALRGVDEVHLLNLAIAPSHQRQGWAHALLEWLVTWARVQNALWLWLEVRPSNSRARHLYKRFGFQEVATRKGYYPSLHGQREDALVMSLAL